jgi:hypothetical protein
MRGDTVRIRDIYAPFYDLSVRISDCDRNRFPNLKKELLYSFRMYYASVTDEFDKKACLRDSKFSRIEVGATITVNGPIHHIRTYHSSIRFGGYGYVILKPELHGREYDVNGDLNNGITEWLVEENSTGEES